jgi:hypothetical protein
VAVLLEVTVEDGAVLLVEADRAEIPQGLVLASPQPGQAAAKATRSSRATTHRWSGLETQPYRSLRNLTGAGAQDVTAAGWA